MTGNSPRPLTDRQTLTILRYRHEGLRIRDIMALTGMSKGSVCGCITRNRDALARIPPDNAAPLGWEWIEAGLDAQDKTGNAAHNERVFPR